MQPILLLSPSCFHAVAKKRCAMSLVTGYDSDSDDEAQPSAPPAVVSRDIASVRPPSSSGLSKEASTPSSTTGKRRADKLQIRVGALSDEGDGVEEKLMSKRPKLDIAAGPSKPSAHSLFSMLPAPTNKNPVLPAKRSQDVESDVPINKMGMSDASTGAMTLQDPIGDEDGADKAKKQKGNNDFRAMLGLKPSKPKEVAVQPVKAAVVEVATMQKAHFPETMPDAPAAPAKSTTHDFFSLDAGGTVRSDASSTPTTFSVTLAPQIEDTEEVPLASVVTEDKDDPYQGWQQGPDGAWFPVTPDAHAQYQQYLASHAQAEQDGRGLRLAERESASGHIDPSRIHDTDVNAGLADWLAKPQIDSGAKDVDRRYALAAASVAQPGQHVALAADDDGRPTDKTANVRARRKGQLSSLIAQAEENRDKLEEKWARGRAAGAEAKKRYGF